MQAGSHQRIGQLEAGTAGRTQGFHIERGAGVEAQVEKVTNALEIAGYGVFGTPAVVIDGEVKSVGKIPKKEEILGWIR